jgi:hypothetical protein
MTPSSDPKSKSMKEHREAGGKIIFMLVYVVAAMLTYCHVTLDGVLDLIFDLLTTLTHYSYLQLIIAPLLISTLYQITLNVFHPAVSSLVISWQLFLTMDIPLLPSSLNGGCLPTELFFRVILRLALYRLSVLLGDKPFETHDQNFYFPTEHLRL